MAAAGLLAAVTMGLAGCTRRPWYDPLGWFTPAARPLAPSLAPPPTPIPDLPPLDRASLSDPFSWLPVIAFGLAAFGALAFVASFWLPIVPRRAAGAAIGLALLFGLIQLALIRFAGPLLLVVLLTAAAGAAGMAPLAILWVRLQMRSLSDRLLEGKHVDAAVALKAAALGRTGENGRDRNWRKKELLANAVQPGAA